MNEQRARGIMGENMIGSIELNSCKVLDFEIDKIPDIPFTEEELGTKKADYLLILGVNMFADGKNVTIRNLKDILGKNPEVFEPCFYNQDWYDCEAFIDTPMENGWFLIRKHVYENSRAIIPSELMDKYHFPSAIKCTYSFFVSWFTKDLRLWYHDFVWCKDVDHNGDRIYVGKYNDIDHINKNGFSIHRHLALRPCYGCID